MRFSLQFRDAPSDTPLVEYRSPYPLPVPRRGETVQLWEAGLSGERVQGTVDRVHWEYQPNEYAVGPAEEVGQDLDVQIQVWLTPV